MATGALIGAIASGVGAAAAGTTILGLSVAGSALLIGVSSFALSSLQSALAPSAPDFDAGGFGDRGLTVQSRDGTASRKGIYGEVYISGSYIAQESVGDDNKFLYIVLDIADHEVQSIGEIWLDNISITDDMLDVDGFVTEGQFKDKVRITKHLGSSTQVVDDDLLSDLPNWTDDHRGQEIAYVVARYEYDNETFPTGVPNLAAWVKGKKIKDPRDGTTKWHVNPSLMLRDYLIKSEEAFVAGMNIPENRINDISVIASANICDEFVEVQDDTVAVTNVDFENNILELDGDLLRYQTGDRIVVSSSEVIPSGISETTEYYVIVYQRLEKPRIKIASSYNEALSENEVSFTSVGGGSISVTKNAEPRYAGGGIDDTAKPHHEMLTRIGSAMAGGVFRVGATWTIKAGSYTSPIKSFDESNIVHGPLRVDPKVNRDERFNVVKGLYSSPINYGQPSDHAGFPKKDNLATSQHVLNDGGRILYTDLNLYFTPRPVAAQRLSKIALNEHRQEMVAEAGFDLTAMEVTAGDVIELSIDQFGWDKKLFEVHMRERRQAEDEDGNPYYYIHLTMRETAPTLWDWDMGEEVRVDPAPNTKLPNPFKVNPPTSLAVYPEEIPTQKNDLTYQFKITWTAPNDAFVTSGGRYEVQFKKSSDTEWRPSQFVDGELTQTQQNQVQPGTNYDVRMRSVNSLGVRSPWTALTGFTVSSPSGATIQIDYGDMTSPITEFIDFGSVSNPVTSTVDYGDLV